MGCTQSKIENEEAVTRCKERKLHMKAAVSYRNAFAAAHSGYQMSLKNTGAALSDYAGGEVPNLPFSPTDPVPLVAVAAAAATAQAYDTPLPPPPPLPNFPGAPLQRAATMPEIKIPKPEAKEVAPTIEEGEEEEDEGEESGRLRRRSSRSSSRKAREGVPVPEPVPPRREEEGVPAAVAMPQANQAWDYFFPSVENVPGPSLSVAEPEEVKGHKVEEEEEVEEEKVEEKPPVAEKVAEEIEPPPPPPVQVQTQQQQVVTGKLVKRVKPGPGGGALVEGKRVLKVNYNLLQIFTDLDDHFLKASESAHDVSKMLEATRLHYHSNFADNRGNQTD